MKNIIAIIFFINSSICATAQMDANWMFGDSVGIRFSSSGITNVSSILNSSEASASISDYSGNLLFYSSGCSVYNKNNYLMDNGDSLISDIYCENSITNGVLIIPFPENDNRYYIFHLNSFQSPFAQQGFFYSVVDMQFNSGLGKVISKNNPLITYPSDSVHLCEKIAATKHANGRDWWLIIDRVWTNEFIKFLVTPNGIFGPYFQNIGRIIQTNTGEMIFNNQGSQLVNACPAGLLDLFDFDRCNGNFSNYQNIGSILYPDNVDSNFFYGATFSPDDSKLYVTVPFKGLLQFNLNSTVDTFGIQKYWIKFNLNTDTISYAYWQMELGSNGIIYLCRGINYLYSVTPDSVNTYLATIVNPNLEFLNCNFLMFGATLNGKHSLQGLPNEPNYNLSALDGSECDTLGLSVMEVQDKKTEVNIYPNPASDKVMIRSFDFDIESITIYNLISQQKTKHNYKNEKEVELHLNNLSSGIYIVEIETANGVVREKFVKE